MEKTYYSINELAEKLKVHSNTIRSWINSGKLCCLQVDSVYRIYEENLIDFRKRYTKNKGESGQMEHEKERELQAGRYKRIF